MQKYTNAIQDVHGNAVAGATIAVYLYGTLTPATIYSDNGSTVIASSSVTSDSTGEFYFYAANGRYTLSVSAPQFASEQVSDVYLYDPTVANVVDKFTATAGQTVFTLSNAPGDIDALLVALNGSVLTPDVDFTLSGVTLTLTVAAAAGDYLVSHYGLPTSQQVIAAGAVTDASVSSSSKLYNRINDWVSVKDFGAVGDGVTDDTAAILAAIATNKAVYFPAGTYLHTGIAITRVNNYVHLEGAGRLKTTLKCVTASAHNISISNTGGSGTYYQYPTIVGMTLEGAAGTGCGIYANGVSIYSFDDLRILSAGSHGIQLTDSGTASSGSYIGRITNCFIQGCTGSGIHQVGTSGTNQQNASWITNCEIRANAHGITCWGNNITVQNCSLEGNTGYGIRFTNEGAAYYSAYNLALKNCYMEANAAGQIYARTNSSSTYGAIVGMEIVDNFISCSNSGNAGYVAVLFEDGGGLSETRALQFRANALTFQTTPTIIANFGNSLGSDCVIAPQYTFSSSTPDYTTTAAKYTGLGMAKFEFVKGLTLSGWAYAKGGSGISYSALNKSANITVTGSNTYFPLPLPLSAHVVQFAVPVETDATSYSIQFVFAGRAYSDAAASFTNRVNPTVSGLSGSQVVATLIMESYTSTGGRQVTTNMDCYLQIVVTLTTPGTYFYLGNPTVFYTEA